MGRTGIGYCYRLYSPAVFSRMDEHKSPEILQLSLNYVVLQLSKIGIKRIFNFPFPTDPGRKRLKESVDYLTSIKALNRDKETHKTHITELGEILSYFSLEPKMSIILLSLNKGKLNSQSCSLWASSDSCYEF